MNRYTLSHRAGKLPTTILLATIFICSTAFAQSGGANGGADRDALQYTQELKQENLDEVSLLEAIANLRRLFESLTAINPPVIPGAGDAFWKDLSPEAIALAKEWEAMIPAAVEKASKILDEIPAAIQKDNSVLIPYEAAWPHYEDRDMKRVWKRTRKAMTKEHDRIAYKYIGNSINALFDPFLGSDRDYYPEGWDYELTGVVHGTNLVSSFYNRCDSVSCLNLIESKTQKYLDAIIAMQDKQISMPEYVKPLSFKKAFLIRRNSMAMAVWKQAFNVTVRHSQRQIDTKKDALLKINLKKLEQYTHP